MKIPKLNQIDPNIKRLSIDDIFNLAMEALATHHIKNALVSLVVFMHATDTDLSKEVLSLSRHSSSLTVAYHVARKVDSIYGHLSSNQAPVSQSNPKSNSDVSNGISDLGRHVIHVIRKSSLAGLNVVLLDKSGNVYQYSMNEPQSIPEANTGLDVLKHELVKQFIYYSSDDGDDDLPSAPDNPNPNNNDDSGNDEIIDFLLG